MTERHAQQSGLLEHIDIQMSDSHMEAWVDLPAGCYVTIETIKAAVTRHDVCFGLRLTALREMLLPDARDRHIVLAAGKIEVDGADGHLEICVEDNLPYSIRADGSHDYHGGASIQEVHEGSPIAEVHSALDGRTGMTVTGEKVAGYNGVEFHGSTVVGSGTRLQENGTILAECTGVFTRNRGGQLQVTDQLIIEGDVDLSVGNIETDRPVLVKGDIQSGFIVKSTSDIVVMGVVEDSRISAGGNLIVRKGILPGRERVKAHGEICVKYIQERRVLCRELHVESIIRHADVSVRTSVYAQSIVGGQLSAGTCIEVQELGSHNGEPTNVRAGVDDYIIQSATTIREEMAALIQQQEDQKDDFENAHTEALQLAQHAQSLAAKKAAKHILAAAVRKARQASEQRELHEKNLNELTARLQAHEKILGVESQHIEGVAGATISIRKNVYAGVEVGFGTIKKRSVISDLSAVVFQCIGDEIIVRM